MFDIGFSELIVIAVVALVVIGPERLPKVARTIGHLLGKAQRYVNDVKTEINREMEIDELRRLQAEMQEAARKLETNVHQTMRETEDSVQQSVKAIEDEVAALEKLEPTSEPVKPARLVVDPVEPLKLDPSDYNPAEKDGPILLSDAGIEVGSETGIQNDIESKHSSVQAVTQVASEEALQAGPQKS